MRLIDADALVGGTYYVSQNDRFVGYTQQDIDDTPTVKLCEDAVSRKRVIILIDEASEIHPYKVVGDSDTYSNYNQGWSDACDWLYANIDGIPSVKPQASEEDIHREREQAYMLGYEDASKKFRTESCEDCRNCKKWNKCPCGKEGHENGTSIGYSIGECKNYESCEDCISREAVIKNIKWWFDKIELNPDILIDSMITLPSVTPKYTDEEIDKAQAVEQAYVDKMVELAIEEVKRPRGKWIRIAGFEDCNYDKCSVCGVYQVFYYGKPSTNFCPNCGAEMDGGAEE